MSPSEYDHPICERHVIDICDKVATVLMVTMLNHSLELTEAQPTALAGAVKVTGGWLSIAQCHRWVQGSRS
jgi:hypothetical protein